MPEPGCTLQPNWPKRRSGLLAQQAALTLLLYLCDTANVVEPLRALFKSSVETGAAIVPWKEYFPPVPLNPLNVILPIN